jgi:glucokinase
MATGNEALLAEPPVEAASTPGPTLGLDIGGTKLATAMVTPDGRHHGLQIAPTRREEGPDEVLRRLFDLGRASIAEAGLGTPWAVGISCGGPLDALAGVLECPPHLPGWLDIPVGDMTSRAFGVPAILENDATAAALAEARFGAGVGARSLIYLTVSTGIGGGSVIDGRLHRGATGNGGELGHITVRPGGRPCTCGRRGCLEAYCSGTAIAARAAEAVAQAADAGRPTELAGIEPLTAAHVSQAAARGDAVAGEVWQETVELLGQALTDLVNVFEPDVAVLGGGVTRAGAMLLDPVARIVRAEAMGREADVVRLELATLGDVVGVVGAAAVAWDRLGASH